MTRAAATNDQPPVAPHRRFARDVLWNIGSLGVLGLTGMLLNAFIMRVYGPQALGSFNQVFAFFIVSSQFAVGGIQFSALRHCSHVSDDLPQCARITVSAMLLVGLGGGGLSLATFACRNLVGELLASPAVATGLALMAPGLLFFSLNKVLLMTLNGLRHMRAFAVFQSLRFIFLMAGVVGMSILEIRAALLPAALTLAELVLFVIQSAYLCHLLPLMQSPFSAALRPWYPRHVAFGLRGFMSGALIELNTRVDVLMLGLFMTDRLVGIYSFAAVFAEGFAQLTIVIRQNLDPIIGRAFAQGRLDDISEAARSVRRRFWPGMTALGLLAMGGFPLVIILFASRQGGWASWPVLCILVAGVVFSAGYRPMSGVFIQGDRPGTYTLIIAGTATVNIILNLLLIPWLGLYGAATATATAFSLESLAVYLLARILLGVRL